MSDTTRAKLKELNVRPSKKKGQNFVVQPFVIDDIIQFGRFDPTMPTVEIGPGMGALTAVLKKAQNLTLVELEPAFCRELEVQIPHARVINADVRGVDFSDIGRDLVVFGNLPYVFSTDIIFHLLSQRSWVKRATLLLQKEFAERVASAPGSRTYGVLSIMVQVWSDPELGPVIPGDAFHPPTKVDSQVLSLNFLQSPKVDPEVIDIFELIVRLAFMQRRKKILNSLRSSKHFDEDVLRSAFDAAGLDPASRAEQLSISDFESLSRHIKLRVRQLE
jgi:16S rRNA (adenine1518-N6/adenine1519-N6)-dimethyltransferase